MVDLPKTGGDLPCYYLPFTFHPPNAGFTNTNRTDTQPQGHTAVCLYMVDLPKTGGDLPCHYLPFTFHPPNAGFTNTNRTDTQPYRHTATVETHGRVSLHGGFTKNRW